MKKYLAELVGTFVLVFGGCGSAVLAGNKIGTIGVALAFGIALLVLVYILGPISGCHLNPAITLGMYVSKKIQGQDVAGYIVAQVVGSILAAAVLLSIAKGAPGGYNPAQAGFAANGYGDHSPGHYTRSAALLTESILTFVLMLTVLGATDSNASVESPGIPIGLILVLIHLIAIPVTNASVNPARSIGPALFVGGWAISQLWLFIIAPIIGALVGAAVYQSIDIADTLISTR